MTPVDIAHLTFLPPSVPGSYNKLVGAQLKGLTGLSQVAISYATGNQREDPELNGHVIHVDRRGLSATQQACLRVPERLRSSWFNGIGGKESLIYAWQLMKELPRLRPRIVVCYDSYKLGPLLRTVIDWPCRLVLSQHGLSYYLSPAEATRLYSLRSFDVVWVLTRSSYRHDRQEVSAYEALVKVIPNGVDTARFQPVSRDRQAALRQKWGLPENRRIVLLLSRLVAKKGAHVIVHSWAKMLAQAPDAFLWIVGGGDREYERSLSEFVRDHLGPESVRLQGPVPPDDISECYQASDIYLFPTLFCEGMALSVLEAMSCGLPCIASEHDVIRELFSDDELVVVADPNVEDSFVDPLVHLLQNGSVRDDLSRRGRAAVAERYSLDRWLNQLSEFYHRQLETLPS